MERENKTTKNFIIGTFVALYVMVSIISTIHVIDFFELSNPKWLAVTLAIAFEVGAAASLASIIALKKMNKGIVWALFILLTLMQAMGNTYYAFVNLEGFSGWIELFGLIDEDPVQQKRIVSFISGAVLPLVALGFIKSLVDYIRPEDNNSDKIGVNDQITDSVTQNNSTNTHIEVEPLKTSEVHYPYDDNDLKEFSEWDITLNDGLEEEVIEEEVIEEEVIEEEVIEEEVIEEEVIEEPQINKELLKKYVMDLIEKNDMIDDNDTEHENLLENNVEPTEETPNTTEVNEENYPVYDNSDELAKKAALDNIMVFVKNGN